MVVGSLSGRGSRKMRYSRSLAEVAAHVGGVAARQQHAAFLRGDDARRGGQLVGLEDHRLVEEGLDQVERDRGDAVDGRGRCERMRGDRRGIAGRRRPAAPRRRRARPFDLSRNSTWPGKIRCGLRICSRFMPHSSGQRHGLFRYRPEMPQSVSRGLTVYESGAFGSSSDERHAGLRGRCAVLRCCGGDRIGDRAGAGGVDAAASRATTLIAARRAAAANGREAMRVRRVMSGSLVWRAEPRPRR